MRRMIILQLIINNLELSPMQTSILGFKKIFKKSITFKLMIPELCHYYFIFLDQVPYIFIGDIFNYII